MSGFVAVPNSGLRACRTPEDHAALLWLCMQADYYGWGEPFEATNREITEASGSSKGRVRSLLERLSAAGCLVIVSPGDRHHGRTVSIASPFPEKVIHHAGHNAGHNDAGNSGDIGQDDSRRNPPRTTLVDPEPEDRLPEPDIAALWEANRKHHPRRKAKPGASDAKYLRARLRESGLETCLLVTDFCNHGSSWWAKNRRTGIATLFKADKWSDRVEQAERWQDHGRQGGNGADDGAFDVLTAALPLPPPEAARLASERGFVFRDLLTCLRSGGSQPVDVQRASMFDLARIRKTFTANWSAR